MRGRARDPGVLHRGGIGQWAAGASGGGIGRREELSTGARKVQVIRTEKREWPDSALGCPRPGEMYAQMLTPGWLIEVRSGQRALEYHTDASDRFVLCTSPP